MFGWFKKQPVQLSSEVRGQILDNGKPVIGQIISRRLIYVDEKVHLDQTVTDNNGNFYFPEKTIMSTLPSKPLIQHNVTQHIFIDGADAYNKKTKNNKITLWESYKPGYKEIKEYKDKLSLMNCDIKNKEVSFKFISNSDYEYRAVSICRWEKNFVMTMLYENDKIFFIKDNDLNKLEEN